MKTDTFLSLFHLVNTGNIYHLWLEFEPPTWQRHTETQWRHLFFLFKLMPPKFHQYDYHNKVRQTRTHWKLCLAVPVKSGNCPVCAIHKPSQ